MMSEKQLEFLRNIVALEEKANFSTVQYWKIFSHLGTWQFWVCALAIVIPLIILYKLIDRKHIFLLGFFGFAVHILITYIENYHIRLGYWIYPYQIIPQISNFSLDAAILPVIYIQIGRASCR